jgi:hypothetical protein
MVRTIMYFTIEEKRKAQCVSSKKYRAKKKAELEANPIPKEPKPLSKSYTREYHQQRYLERKEQLKQQYQEKKLLKLTSCSLESSPDTDSESL